MSIFEHGFYNFSSTMSEMVRYRAAVAMVFFKAYGPVSYHLWHSPWAKISWPDFGIKDFGKCHNHIHLDQVYNSDPASQKFHIDNIKIWKVTHACVRNGVRQAVNQWIEKDCYTATINLLWYTMGYNIFWTTVN